MFDKQLTAKDVYYAIIFTKYDRKLIAETGYLRNLMFN